MVSPTVDAPPTYEEATKASENTPELRDATSELPPVHEGDRVLPTHLRPPARVEVTKAPHCNRCDVREMRAENKRHGQVLWGDAA
ncbi:hypothetical protein Aduo_011017 [Ancylostoma duodenale]